MTVRRENRWERFKRRRQFQGVIVAKSNKHVALKLYRAEIIILQLLHRRIQLLQKGYLKLLLKIKVSLRRCTTNVSVIACKHIIFSQPFLSNYLSRH